MQIKADKLSAMAKLAAKSGKLPEQVRLYLLTGPDEAGNDKICAELGAAFGKGLERVDFNGNELKNDPALLVTEAASLSLFGDGRWIKVVSQKEETLHAIRMLLEAENVVNPVVIIAHGATDKSRISKEVSPSKHGYICHNYLPNAGEMTKIIADMAREKGLDMEQSMARHIADYTSNNVLLAEMELDKIALYCDADAEHPQKITPETIAALGAAHDEDDIFPVLEAALSGDMRVLKKELRRMAEMGMAEVAILLLLQRQVVKLAGLAARLGNDRNIGQFVENEARARRVFFGEKNAVKTQLAIWNAPLLHRLSERLLNLQQDIMAAGTRPDSQMLVEHELITIAQLAARRKPRMAQ